MANVLTCTILKMNVTLEGLFTVAETYFSQGETEL